MLIFAESPWPLVVTGLALAAVLATAYHQTRQPRWLALMAAPVAIAIAGFVIDGCLVTDREAVSDALMAAVNDFKANDLEATLVRISADAAETRAMATMGLTVHHIRFARVRNIRVTVNRLTSPPSATVSFRGFGSGHVQVSESDRIRGSRTVDVTVPYRLEGGRWMIVDGVTYESIE